MAQQINLYDPALKRQRDWLALTNVVALMAVLIGLVGAAGYVARLGLPPLQAQASQQEAQLAALRTQLTSLGQQMGARKPDARLEQEIINKRQLLGLRDEVRSVLRQQLSETEGSRFTDYLLGFARQTVNGLWLTDFAIDAVSGGIEIKGCTTDPALLPEYIRRLNNETAFQGRAFSALKLAAVKGDPAAPQAGAANNANLANNATRPCAQGGRNHEFTLIPLQSGAALPGKLTANRVNVATMRQANHAAQASPQASQEVSQEASQFSQGAHS